MYSRYCPGHLRSLALCRLGIQRGQRLEAGNWGLFLRREPLSAPCQALRWLHGRGPIPCLSAALKQASLRTAGIESVGAGPASPPRSASGLLGRLHQAWALW